MLHGIPLEKEVILTLKVPNVTEWVSAQLKEQLYFRKVIHTTRMN